eukprot:9393326-Prorocentrum_lima.AAC.1
MRYPTTASAQPLPCHAWHPQALPMPVVLGGAGWGRVSQWCAGWGWWGDSGVGGGGWVCEKFSLRMEFFAANMLSKLASSSQLFKCNHK